MAQTRSAPLFTPVVRSRMLASRKALNHHIPVAHQIRDCISSIRKEPAEEKHRVALAQLYMATRDWQKASDQLERAAQLAPACIPLAAAYCEAIRCEVVRGKVLAGERQPAVSDSAPDWVSMLVSALQPQALNEVEQAARIRSQAFDEADACSFEVNGQPAAWLADADSRLGPVCELFMNGEYHWVPFADIAVLQMEPPEDLRDLFWLPCSVQLLDGQSFSALMPCRYPQDLLAEDDDLLLCRKTQWRDAGPDAWLGAGQKVFVTDRGEFPVLSVRSMANKTPPLN